MTIEDPTVVDYIGIDRESRKVILTISDHLPWCDCIPEHTRALEAKVSAYVELITSGRLVSAYPLASGRDIEIRAVCLHRPTKEAEVELASTRERLAEIGVHFGVKVLPGLGAHEGWSTLARIG